MKTQLTTWNRLPRWGAIAVAALTAVLTAQANEHDKDKPYSDTSFVEHATLAHTAEASIGQMAQQKGQNAEAKRLGERLNKDHTQANQELKRIAQRLGVSATQTPNAKHEEKLSKLKNATGAEFDKEFAKCMVIGHKKGVAKYEKASQQAQDAELKAYVNKTLPTLRQHLQAAQSLARAVGVDDAAISAAEREADNEAAGKPESATESGTGRLDERIKDKELRQNTPDRQINQDDPDRSIPNTPQP